MFAPALPRAYATPTVQAANTILSNARLAARDEFVATLDVLETPTCTELALALAEVVELLNRGDCTAEAAVYVEDTLPMGYVKTDADADAVEQAMSMQLHYRVAQRPAISQVRTIVMVTHRLTNMHIEVSCPSLSAPNEADPHAY